MVGNKRKDEIQEAMLAFQTHNKIGNKTTSIIIEKGNLSSIIDLFAACRTEIEGLELFKRSQNIQYKQ